MDFHIFYSNVVGQDYFKRERYVEFISQIFVIFNNFQLNLCSQIAQILIL